MSHLSSSIISLCQLIPHRRSLPYSVSISIYLCLPFIRSGQNHLARHSERGKKTRQTDEEVGRQHQGMDRPGVRQVPEGSGEQGKMEKTGCEIICGAPRPSRVKVDDMMTEDGEKFRGTAKAHQDFPQSITADSIKGLDQVYESCI